MQATLEGTRGRLASFYSDDQPRVPAGSSDGGQWAAGTGSTHEQPWAAPVRNYLAKTEPPTPAETSALANHLRSLTTEQLRGLRADHGVAASASSKAVLVGKLREKFAEARAKNTAPQPVKGAVILPGSGITQAVLRKAQELYPQRDFRMDRWGGISDGKGVELSEEEHDKAMAALSEDLKKKPEAALPPARTTTPAQAESVQPPKLYGTDKQVAYAESVRSRVLRDAEKYVAHREATGHPDAAKDRAALTLLKQEASARYWIDGRNDGIGDHLESMRNMHAPFSADVDNRGRLVAVFAEDDDAGGHWITIGAEDHEGGTPVFIKDGVITKGPADLTNRRIDNLKAPPPHPSEEKYDKARGEADRLHGEAVKANNAAEAAAVGEKRNADADATAKAARAAYRKAEAEAGRAFQGRRQHEAKDSREASRKEWGQKAKEIGHKPEHLHALAAEMRTHDKAAVDDRLAMLQDARKQLKNYGYDARTIAANSGNASVGDWTKIPHFDSVAQSMAWSHPGQFSGHASTDADAEQTGNAPERLWDLLLEGNPRPMHEEEAYRQALDELSRHAPEKVSRARGDAYEGRSSGKRPSAAVEDVPFADDGRGRLAAFYDEDEAREPAGGAGGGRWTAGGGGAAAAAGRSDHAAMEKAVAEAGLRPVLIKHSKGPQKGGLISVHGMDPKTGGSAFVFHVGKGFSDYPSDRGKHLELKKKIVDALHPATAANIVAQLGPRADPYTTGLLKARAGQTPAPKAEAAPEKPKPIANPFDSFKKAPAPQGQLFEPRATDTRPDPNARDKALRDLSAVQKRSADWDMPQIDRKYGGATITHLPSGHKIETTAMGDEYMVKDAAGKKVAQFREAKDAADYIEKQAGKSEPSASGLAPVTQTTRGKLFDFSADGMEDNRGRLVAAFDMDGDNDAPRPMPLDNLYYGFAGLPRRHALGLMHDAAERSHHDNLGHHHHAVDFADDNRGRLAEFYSPDQLRASDGKWTAGAGDEAAREHSLRSIREFAAKPDAPSREELEQLGGHLSRLTVKQLRQVRDEHGLRGSGPDKEQFVAKLGEKFVAHRAGNAMSPAERHEYDASKKAVAAIKQHGAESPEAKAAGEEHRAAWEGLRREESGEAAKPMVMPAAAQITQEKKEIASTPIDDRGRIVDNKPVETKPQPQETKMDATATKDAGKKTKLSPASKEWLSRTGVPFVMNSGTPAQAPDGPPDAEYKDKDNESTYRLWIKSEDEVVAQRTRKAYVGMEDSGEMETETKLLRQPGIAKIARDKLNLQGESERQKLFDRKDRERSQNPDKPWL